MQNKTLIYLSAIFLPIFLISCNQGTPDITYSCTLNGQGNAYCEFQNNGTAEGSVCVNFMVEKFNAGPESEYKIGSGTGFILTSSESVCSGIVKIGDIREREKALFFKDEARTTMTPYDFCETNSNFDVGRSMGLDIPYNEWTQFCEIFLSTE
mgnify:CR=1 FL=1